MSTDAADAPAARAAGAPAAEAPKYFQEPASGVPLAVFVAMAAAGVHS
jgi:hypothetical protein